MTKRDQIVQEINGYFQAISIANGYSFDVANVYEWREIAFSKDECPAIEFRDLDDSVEDHSDVSQHLLHFQTRLYLDMQKTTLAQARDAMQDVVKAFGNILTGNSGVAEAYYEYSEPELEHEKDKILRVDFDFYVTYFTDFWRI